MHLTIKGGQDGSYLSEFLLQKDYFVVMMIRRSSTCLSYNRILPLLNLYKDKCVMVTGEMNDVKSLTSLIEKYKPNEVYNLAAQSDVRQSFDTPYDNINVDMIGVLNLLEIISKYKDIKLYQAR